MQSPSAIPEPDARTARPRSFLAACRRRPLACAVVTLGLLALLILLLGAAGAELDDEDPMAASTGPLPVSVARIEVVDAFEIRERVAGRIVSRRRSELGFERSGRLAEVLVDEGDRVEAGALLALLDTRELSAAAREQRARLASTRARLDLAKLTARRQRRLSESGTLAAQVLDEALADEASLEAQLAADRAALERTEVALELSRLEAPYPAIIVRRHLDEGSIAGPGGAVLSVIEAGARDVNLGVPPEVAVGFEAGREYVVESGGQGLRATLRNVLPELDPLTRTQTVILEVKEPEDRADRLADGSLVWVHVGRRIPARGAWLPIASLAEGHRGTWTAFAVVEDEAGASRVERRVVEIIQTEASRVFVRGTLGDGDRIVVDGLHRLIPGLEVSVREASPDAAIGEVAAAIEP